ncbi:MAG: ABC transporter permease [Lachnospiraceae bacterium]|nr:ABC transporter permease [Lachnospiraceae bacterium]
MGIFLDYWKMAFFNIRANKVRAFLTMLGIIIGVSSVVTVMSIGNGVRNYISGSLSSIAGSYFELYITGGKPLSRDVVENLVSKYDEITGYTENLSANGTVKGVKKEVLSLNIESGSPMLEKKSPAEIIYGRYFTADEYDNCAGVCVIDQNGASEIFGTDDPVGKMMNIDAYGRELSLKVVGVRKSGSSIEALLFGGNNIKIEIPSTVLYETFSIDSEYVADVMVFVDSPDVASEMSIKGRRYVEAALDERGLDFVKTYELNSGISSFSSILTGITVFIMMVAAISLFVGGVGVMNIMLVSVTERTREIGIRKSLGAGTSSILWQFLIESGLISLTGGIIGILSGYGVSLIVSAIIKGAGDVMILPEFNVILILAVSAFSMGIGIFFGWYPAKKAAKMTPIEALRA